jgi:hypothetical protein
MFSCGTYTVLSHDPTIDVPPKITELLAFNVDELDKTKEVIPETTFELPTAKEHPPSTVFPKPPPIAELY